MWGKDSDVFMQLLHFAFGFGGIFGPIIAKPYLLPLPDTDEELPNNTQLTTSTPFDSTQNLTNGSSITTITNYTPDNLLIQSAYQIIALYSVCLSGLFLYIFVRYRHTPQHPSRVVAANTSSDGPRLNECVFRVVIVLATLFLHVYYGLEIAMASFMTTYAVKSDLKLSKATGAMITSVYWSTFTFFRLVTVFYVNMIGPEKNIIFELIIVMVANCFLVPFGDTYPWCLWVGAALIGMGMSAIWASMFAYLEQYFPLSNKICATFTVFACVGELIFPNLMGLLIVNVSLNLDLIDFIMNLCKL